jgi:hypothetical protein
LTLPFSCGPHCFMVPRSITSSGSASPAFPELSAQDYVAVGRQSLGAERGGCALASGRPISDLWSSTDVRYRLSKRQDAHSVLHGHIEPEPCDSEAILHMMLEILTVKMWSPH